MATQGSWIDGPMTGFDTETTGVDVDRDRIVTAALVHRPGRSAPDHVRSWLVDPGMPIPAAATAVHGIDTATAHVHGRRAVEAVEEIARAVVEVFRRGEPVVAYNAAYDLTLLDMELRRHRLPGLAERLGSPLGPVLDPLVLDRAVDPYRPGKRRLGDLCAHYGITTGALHSADADVAATLDVLAAVVRGHPELAALDLVEMHALQVGAHRRWAESFNAWRQAKGLPGDGAATDWPMRESTAAPVRAVG